MIWRFWNDCPNERSWGKVGTTSKAAAEDE
jgi:hypothetical protein